MPYYPIIPNADDRKRRGIVPVDLVNAYVEPNTQNADNRAPYVLVPTPGRTRRVEFPANVRGLYAKPGVQSGTPFVVAGSSLYSVSSSWSATGLGAIGGGEVVQWAPFRQAFGVVGGGQIKHYDSGTLSPVTDPDAPANAGGLTQAGYRLIAFETGGDAFGWSKAGLYNDWDPNGQAADFDLPDPIIGQEEQGGDLISFNAESIQRWRPTGGIESEAFSPTQSGLQNMGLMGRNLIARINGGLGFVNHKRVPHWLSDGGPVEWSNRALSDALLTISAANRAGGVAFAYPDGDAEFFGLRFEGLQSGYVRDTSTGLWHERRRYNSSQYDVGFTTAAYDSILCAGPDSPYLWSFDRTVYTDDGDPIVRVMTVKADLPNDMPINSVCLDVRCYDHPASGQGTEPVMMLEYSRDGGRTWSGSWGDVRSVNLPTAADPTARPVEWQFGLFTRQNGFMLRLSFSEPIGFAMQGVWLNSGYS